jgi:hypothetical protein
MDPAGNAGAGQVTWRRALLALVVFTIASVVIWRAKGRWPAGHEPLAPLPDGGEIFAIDLGIITEVQYDTATRKLVARRPGGSHDRFFIEITDPGGHIIETCIGGHPFDEVLANLASIRVRKALEKDEADALRSRRRRDFARLRIVDNTALEPQEYDVLLATTSGPVFLVDGPIIYESAMQVQPFEQLSRGCVAVGADGGR